MCFDFETLNLYVDNELDTYTNFKINTHLITCKKCSQIINNIKLTKDLLNKEEYKIPTDFIDNLLNSLPTTIPCPDYEALSSYYDNILSLEEKSQIENHLNECKTCFNKFKSIQNLSKSIKNLPTCTPSEEFLFKVLSQTLSTNKGDNKYTAKIIAAITILLVGVLFIPSLSELERFKVSEDKIYIKAEDFLFTSFKSTDSSLDILKDSPNIPIVENNPS